MRISKLKKTFPFAEITYDKSCYTLNFDGKLCRFKTVHETYNFLWENRIPLFREQFDISYYEGHDYILTHFKNDYVRWTHCWQTYSEISDRHQYQYQGYESEFDEVGQYLVAS